MTRGNMAPPFDGTADGCCRSCGVAEPEYWADLDTEIGVVRVALCPGCSEAVLLPRLGPVEAVTLAHWHPHFRPD